MGITKEKKKELVSKVKADLQKYPTVGIASIEGLPGKQYDRIKKKTKDKVRIDFARLTLLKRAIDESGRQELKELERFLGNATCLVCSDLDAFKLFKLFKQNKSKSLAKPGQVAPNDIIVPAGPTSLTPGPVLTDLKNAKIQARIQGPNIVIAKDAVVAKKGEEISEAAASVLAKLGIEPVDVGLGLKAVWDNGTLYEASVLDVDEQAFLVRLQEAHRNALAVCIYAELFNESSTPLLIGRAAVQAKALQKLIEEKTGVPTEEKKEEKPAEEKPSEEAKQEEKPAEEEPAEEKPSEEPKEEKPTEEQAKEEKQGE